MSLKPMQVHWIIVPSSDLRHGGFGVCQCPGKKPSAQVQRDLAVDLAKLQSDGVTAIACLLNEAELRVRCRCMV
jgi:hypothetical protein